MQFQQYGIRARLDVHTSKGGLMLRQVRLVKMIRHLALFFSVHWRRVLRTG